HGEHPRRDDVRGGNASVCLHLRGESATKGGRGDHGPPVLRGGNAGVPPRRRGVARVGSFLRRRWPVGANHTEARIGGIQDYDRGAIAATGRHERATADLTASAEWSGGEVIIPPSAAP